MPTYDPAVKNFRMTKQTACKAPLCALIVPSEHPVDLLKKLSEPFRHPAAIRFPQA